MDAPVLRSELRRQLPLASSFRHNRLTVFCALRFDVRLMDSEIQVQCRIELIEEGYGVQAVERGIDSGDEVFQELAHPK